MRFLILFAAIVGLTFAGTVKQDLLKRLENAEHTLQSASAEYTRRGFDYFAEVVDNYNFIVQVTQKDVELLDDNVNEVEAAKQVKDVTEIEKEVPNKVRFPALREIFKTGGLYLATIKNENHDSATPTPDVLKKQVSDIILQENHLKTLHDFPTDQREHERTTMNLNTMYDALVNNLKDSKVPSPDDFNKLEAEAHKKVDQFNKEGKHEQAKLIQDALDKFLNATFQVAKVYPVDSLTRYNQFLASAPAHYQDYRILNALVFLGSLSL